jgi:hypothetical protein
LGIFYPLCSSVAASSSSAVQRPRFLLVQKNGVGQYLSNVSGHNWRMKREFVIHQAGAGLTANGNRNRPDVQKN